MKSKTVTLYGLLVAAAMVLSFLETKIPLFLAVPGMKPGLTNMVVLLALYTMGEKSAIFINLVRIVLVALLFGTALSFAYSLAGGLLSGAVMILLKRTGRFQIMTVSVAGAVTHNIGQIAVAVALLGTPAIAWYLLALWFSGIAGGLVVGFLAGQLCKRLKRFMFKE